VNTTIADQDLRQIDGVLSAEAFLQRGSGEATTTPSSTLAAGNMPFVVGPNLEVQMAHQVPPPPRYRVLGRLLAMADSYLRADSLRQALEMYHKLAQEHPDAAEGMIAEERLLDVARRHEEAGEMHSARAIYEQLV
jgi:hypothetical protein